MSVPVEGCDVVIAATMLPGRAPRTCGTRPLATVRHRGVEHALCGIHKRAWFRSNTGSVEQMDAAHQVLAKRWGW